MSEYEAHSKRMRQVICNAMADLLSEKTFLKITVRDVMDKAEIQRATFYRYFRDKYEVAETVNKHISSFLTQKFFSAFYRGCGFSDQSDLFLDGKYNKILYKMLDLRVENVNLQKNLSDAFLGEYMNAFPDAGEFEAYLAAQNFLSIVSWMAKTNASITEVRHFLESDAQQRWLARFYNVSPRSFSEFLSDIRNHT
jgi:AcrR family transcriptional regulator